MAVVRPRPQRPKLRPKYRLPKPSVPRRVGKDRRSGTFFGPLLITPPPVADESGIGYVVRASEANGYPTASYVLDLVGTGSFDCFGEGRARQLSRLLNLPWARAEDFIPFWIKSTRQSSRWRWMGHAIQPLFLSFLRARVCPLCLAEAPYIRAIWDLWLITHCPIHNGRLIDACPRCGEPITVKRPFLLWCACGFRFAEAPLGPKIGPSSSLTAILDAVGAQMAIPRGQRVEPLASLFSPRLADVRLDAVLILIFLIGAGSLRLPFREWSGLPAGDMPSRVIEASDRAWEKWPEPDLGGLNGHKDAVLLQMLNRRMKGLALVLREAEALRASLASARWT